MLFTGTWLNNWKTVLSKKSNSLQPRSWFLNSNTFVHLFKYINLYLLLLLLLHLLVLVL